MEKRSKTPTAIAGFLTGCTNANFKSSQLSHVCFVDATLTGANLKGTNISDAIFCRTTMPDGSTQNTGCTQGTACCPTCDSAHPCGSGQVCCGTCCDPGQVCDTRSTAAHCCTPEDPAVTCAVDSPTPKCGSVRNNCGQAVACGDVCASGCPFSSVQAAINAAPAGATIRICAGTYTERLTVDKNLTLLGVGSGAGGTILNGGGLGTTLTLFPSTVTVQAMTITGGQVGAGSLGGGIAIFGAHLTLGPGSRVTGNSAGFGGAGVWIASGTLTMQAGSSVAVNHSANVGGGMYISSGGTASLETGSSVTGNIADNLGGGVWNALGTLNVADTTIVTGNVPNNCRGTPVPPTCIG